MRRALVPVFALLVGLAVIPVADGHLLWHHDPRGDADIDDLIGVHVSSYRRDGVKMLKLTADLASSDPADSCCYTVSFVFDSRGDGDADFVYSLSYDGASGGIYAESLRTAEGDQIAARFIRACTEDDGSCPGLPVRFKTGLLHPTRHIRWYVTTNGDRAPAAGWFEH